MKKTFNELDQWLVQNWTGARQLEESMIAIQEKYKIVCNHIIDLVKEETPRLNTFLPRFQRANFCIAFGRKEWPSQNAAWPTGLWVGGFGLDSLITEEGDRPYASIWLSCPKGTNFDLEVARTKIQNAADELMKGEKLNCLFEDDPGTCLLYYIPESRETLKQMLLNDETENFCECIVSHVMILARFIPVLDEILLKNRP
jgi:hypothetical protein